MRSSEKPNLVHKETAIPLNWEEFQHVDATPDGDYPLRILRAHLAINRDYKFAGDSGNQARDALFDSLNVMMERRVTILENAIAVLSHSLEVEP